MALLVTYVFIMAATAAGVATFSVMLEQWASPFTSLLVFFLLFFSSIWAAWVLSVWLTRPRGVTQDDPI